MPRKGYLLSMLVDVAGARQQPLLGQPAWVDLFLTLARVVAIAPTQALNIPTSQRFVRTSPHSHLLRLS
jgi:hypothetical protein